MSSKYRTLSFINRAEEVVESELKFSAACKNTGRFCSYDLSSRKYAYECRRIYGVFAWALFRLRDSHGHSTRIAVLEKVTYFFKYLEVCQITLPQELTDATLVGFASWLKSDSGLSYPTAANTYRSLTRIFQEMSKHDLVSNEFNIQRNSFPKASSQVASQLGYNEDELKTIMKAAVLGVRESASKLERAYQPRWLGCPPPLDDVAPQTVRGGHSRWQSKEHRIWWWENNCGCRRVSANDLKKIPHGQNFFHGMSPSGRGSVTLLNDFYDEIGADKDYKPRFLGVPTPIKYRSPWAKKEYLEWYWENHLECRPLTTREAKERDPKFLQAISDNFNSRIKQFFSSMGLQRWVGASDLIPYYLMLLVRTGLNPSTIQRLTVDCLIQDPTDGERFSINWEKFRSSKRGATIPSSQENDKWPVSLIKRVIQITASIREPGQSELWIANANKHKKTQPLGSSAFQRGVQQFSVKHKLLDRDGLPLILQAKLLRPTLAWHEYVRTEDLSYLSQLLGHSKLSTTAEYIRRLEDPILRIRRGIHQDAMFLGLLSGELNLPDKSTDSIIASDCVLNHCRDQLNSPQAGQKPGAICSSGHEVCLGCQNLIITLEDIKKYYCFVGFHEHLLSVGDIGELEFSQAIGEKRFFWETYILPKYPQSVVQRIATEALRAPIEAWDIAKYEQEKQNAN
ncbi:tyrosine-type recombinase/integrase [Pseudomonas monteilii]|uniref:tyrosine-type recombinase/integrase n=1 Tax=Pseudomonas TaxID=286 RepID=UPI0004B74A53|nr:MULTISPECIES: tyrosine-type recombinase/integrase [Pseudomonas]MBH3455476.1 tyrosine-type recombinase/integrase [Pseudomonas monteilii]